MMTRMNKCFAALCMCALLIIFLPVSVFAAENEDAFQPVSLTVFYQDGDTPLSGAQFSIYHLGSINNRGDFSVADAFQRYNVNIQTTNASLWPDLATTLEGYILRDGIVPIKFGETDAFGRLTFSIGSNEMQQGLYLIISSRHIQEGYVYETVPAIVFLPQQSSLAKTNEYNFSMRPKFTCMTIGRTTSEPITRKVMKIWDDDGCEAFRPKEVVVQLLQDNKVFDTVTLNKNNNWEHTWNNLSQGHIWRITEKELEQYIVSVSNQNNTFVVTNTYTGRDSLVPDPPVPFDDLSPPDSPTLPQSGQLWWPVPLFSACGLIVICVGCFLRRDGKNKSGMLPIFLGFLMVIGSVFLTAYNLYIDYEARKHTQPVLNCFSEVLTEVTGTVHETSSNIHDVNTNFIVETELPDFILYPEMEMPIETINGQEYIGVLEFTSKNLTLPVISRWDDSKLKIAPCRYKGSVYTNDLILVAHNYSSHFGCLKNLLIGDVIVFTDASGNEFRFEVADFEIIMPYDIEGMESGDWDLTLFTCTLGGSKRLAVRCNLMLNL